MIPMKVKGITSPMSTAAISQPTNLAHQPHTDAAYKAHQRQWRLHPGRAFVARRPLSDGRACVEREARRLFGDVDVESRACEECSGQYGNQAEDVDHRILNGARRRCTPAVGANDRTKQLENEIGKSVDDAGLLVESRRRVDHAEHPRPGGYPIEVTESALQASKDGKRSHPSGEVALLNGELTTQLAQRLSKRSVRVLRSMA